jgi:hypothetical protein
MEDDEEGDRSADTFIPFQMPGGLALSCSEKGKSWSTVLRLFQPLKYPSVIAGIETVHEVMCAYEHARMWTEIKQPFAGPTDHQGTQRWRGSGNERHFLEHPPNRSITLLRKCLTQSSAGSTSHQHWKKPAWYAYWRREKHHVAFFLLIH